MKFNVYKIREDFPILKEKIYNKPLVYLDNGATTQKPRQVIEIVNEFHAKRNSSIHRGIHFLSEQATEAYENARETVRDFLNASSTKEIIFTSGSTGSLNGLAFSLGEKLIKPGDEIIISEMEHHANIVPWQMVCERKNAKLKIIPFNDNGELIFDEYVKLLNEKTKIVSLIHASNILGTINPIKKYIDKAHGLDIPVIIDAAQSIQHIKTDVKELDCDFLVFSGHKLYGPTGIGIIYGKEKWLNEIPPFHGGGDMVDKVTFIKTTYNEIPFKFEAGTTNFIGAIGMAEAIKYIEKIGLSKISDYEQELLQYATSKLNSIEGLKIYGNSKQKVSIISFNLKGIHFYDAGTIIDKMGIAVRTGTHCGQPIMQHFGIEGNIRASMVFYNTKEEIDLLFQAIQKVKKMFS